MAVVESTKTVGRGILVLSGRVPGHTAFHTQVPDGTTINYCIRDYNGSFEIGTGVYTAGTLTRNVREKLEEGAYRDGGPPIHLTGHAVVGVITAGSVSPVSRAGSALPYDLNGTDEQSVPMANRRGGLLVLPVLGTSLLRAVPPTYDFADALQAANDEIVQSGTPGMIDLFPANYQLSKPVFIDTSFVGIRGNDARITVTAEPVGQNMVTLGASIGTDNQTALGMSRFSRVREVGGFTLAGPSSGVHAVNSRDNNYRLIYCNSDVAGSSVRIHLHNIRLSNAHTLLAVGSRAYFLRGSWLELANAKFCVHQDAGASDFAENVFFEGSTFFNSDCLVKDSMGQKFRFKACSFDFFGDSTGYRITPDDAAFDIHGSSTIDLDDCHIEFDYGKYVGQTNHPIRMSGSSGRIYMRRGKIYYADSGCNPYWSHLIYAPDNGQLVSLDDVELYQLGRTPTNKTSDDSLVRGSDPANITGGCAEVKLKHVRSPQALSKDVPSIGTYHYSGGALRHGSEDPYAELSFRTAVTGTATVSRVASTDTTTTPNVSPRNAAGSQMKITGQGKVCISMPLFELARRHAWVFFLNGSAGVGSVTVRERSSTVSNNFNGSTVTLGVDARASYTGSPITVTLGGANEWVRVSWRDMSTTAGINARRSGSLITIEIDTSGMTSGALFLDDFAFDTI